MRKLLCLSLFIFLGACSSSDGKNGTSGQACWDLNSNGTADLATEDTNADGTVDVYDCRSAATGSNGVACWDLNGNGTGDLASEDTNSDGVVNVLDCRATGTTTLETRDLSDTAVVSQMVSDEDRIQASILGASATGAPVVSFQLTDSHGVGLTNLSLSSIGFTFAKLIAAGSGQPEHWQSYINSIESSTSGSDQNPDTLVQALQANRDRNGTLVDNGDGSYSYTFSNNVTAISSPVAISWEPTLTHRVGFEVRVDEAINPDNPTFTFVPDGSAVATTKDIADTTSCNQCHAKLALHGGGRFTTKYCVTCHNPSTRDEDSGALLDMAHMVHAVHSSSFRGVSYPYQVYGFGETVTDFSEVTYPQSTLFCETCHTANADQPNGDRWKTTVTAESCGGCHASGLVASAADAITGVSTYQFNHNPKFALIADDSQCQSCHAQGTGITWENRTIDAENSHLQKEKLAKKVADEEFQFQVMTVTNFAATQFPVITFKISNPLTSTTYNITTDSEFTNASASLTLDIAWGTGDYNNKGSGSVGVGTGPPAQPIQLNLAYLKANAVHNVDGSYTVTSNVALPASMSGPVAVAMEGHPIADRDLNGDALLNDSVPVKGEIYFTGTARRDIVDIAKCDKCHQYIAFHGSNRSNEPQLCVTCHNPDATDIRRRAGAGVTWAAPGVSADQRGEQGIAYGYMVHGIHSGTTVVYGNGNTQHDYSDITFPGELKKCTTCHMDDTYYGNAGDKRPVSVGTGADRSTPDDDEVITATAAMCYPCHKTSAAIAHMEQNGAVVEDGSPLTSSGAGFAEGGRPLKANVGLTASSSEACETCHKKGGLVDIGVAHGVE